MKKGFLIKGVQKSLGALFIVATLFIGLFSNAKAEETLSISLGNIHTAEDKLYVQISDNTTLKATELSYVVELDGEPCQIISADLLQDTDEGISYMFLVDVSGSIKDVDLAEIKLILTDLVSQMRENDNACIMLVGNEAKSGTFTNNKEETAALIEEIAVTHEDTNLYLGMSEAISQLDSSLDANGKKVLVVFSDGVDDQTTGITKEEVDKAVVNSDVSIFTVALDSSKSSAEADEAKKLFGSFARESVGGEHYLVGSTIDSTNVASDIVARVLASRLIVADITGFKVEGSECSVKVTVDSELGQVSETKKVDASVIKEGLSIAPAGAEESTNGNGLIIFIVILVAVILLVVLIVRGKKKDKESAKLLEESEEKRVAVEYRLENLEDQAKDFQKQLEEKKEKEVKEREERIKAAGFVKGETPIISNLTVICTKMGALEGAIYELNLEYGADPVVVGRNKDKANWVISDDMKLSNSHCKISLGVNGNPVIEDLGSTNGTLVNGIKIAEPFTLSDNDVISFGNNEWRINY